MPQNPKRIPIPIANPPAGCRPWCSLAHARRYIKRGWAELRAGSLHFFRATPSLHHPPNLDVASYDIFDSGFHTAPYPQPNQSGPKFPALAQKGAGL